MPKKNAEGRAQAAESGRLYLRLRTSGADPDAVFTILPTIRACLLSFTNATALSLNPQILCTGKLYVYVPRQVVSAGARKYVQAAGRCAGRDDRACADSGICHPPVQAARARPLPDSALLSQSGFHDGRGNYLVVRLPPDDGPSDLADEEDRSRTIRSLPWAGNSRTALWCIAIALVWQATGYYMIMHIAAMDGISPEIYEAATLDGASSTRKFISITIPLMKNIIGITFVLAMSGTLVLSFVLAGHDRRRAERRVDGSTEIYV